MLISIMSDKEKQEHLNLTSLGLDAPVFMMYFYCSFIILASTLAASGFLPGPVPDKFHRKVLILQFQ